MARALPGVPKPILTPLQTREKAARRTIAALGYNECVTYSFIDAAADTEALAVDTSCVESLPRPPAFQPVRAASVAGGRCPPAIGAPRSMFAKMKPKSPAALPLCTFSKYSGGSHGPKGCFRHNTRTA